MEYLLSLIQSIIGFDWESFVVLAGRNPFSAMLYFTMHGGWIVLVWLILWGARELWLEHKQVHAYLKKEWILLKIRVPSTSEQTVKAMENAFASLAGAHSPSSWHEKWIQGKTQSQISMEIVSIDGQVGFYVRAERPMRDLIEAAVYAQYPDAEIREVDDYAQQVPSHYPDEDWDLWGTEMIPVKEDAYPLRTYWEFKDDISGEFKDPLAAMLENFSRLGPGEQAWYQIIIVPTDQKAERARAEKLMKKLRGEKEEHKQGFFFSVLEFPLTVLKEIMGILFPAPQAAPKKSDSGAPPKILMLSPIEKQILEAVERKASKIGFLCKVRFLYVSKKTAHKKAKAVQPFIGAIKQMNTFHMQALKPESKHVGVNGTLWFFKARRNDHRKHELVQSYRARSAWRGTHPFFLCAEELATMWHFPILLQVKAPSLDRTEAKKAEPPNNIPFV